MLEVALGTSTQKITLPDKTKLYYVPISGFYGICATKTDGSGKWYLCDSSQGGRSQGPSSKLPPR